MVISPLSGIEIKNELVQIILKEYDIKITNTQNTSDGIFLCQGDCSTLQIKKYNDKESHLIFFTGIYDHIKNTDFKKIVKIYISKSGKYYFRWMDDFYIVSDYIDSKKNKFAYEENIYDAVKLLGTFHKASRGYITSTGGKAECDWGKWPDKYNREYKDIKRYKDTISNKDNKTQFDRLFLNNANEYLERMENSIKILKKNVYLNTVEDSMKMHQICLCNFKQCNFVQERFDILIKSLGKCKYDIVERDIADLMKETLKYCVGLSTNMWSNILSIYDKENTLMENSIDIIKAFIIYPDQFEKICFKYYSDKDKWTQEGYISKLTESMALQNRKVKFIEALTSTRE